MERYDEKGDLVEGGFCKGDIIICEIPDGGHFDVGDSVMFSMPVNLYPDGSHRECDRLDEHNTEIIVTHRIVGIEMLGETYRYRTQGLRNPMADINLKWDEDILAVYTGIRIPHLGSVMDFMQTQGGFFLCIILPMLAFVLFQAYRVVNNVILYNREKAIVEASENATAAELTEEQKRRIAEEYLRSLSQSTTSSEGSQPQGTEE
jgi:signal peptidase